MSIQSEINRITQNIASTYSVAESAGATMPTEQNSDNLAATVASAISSASSSVFTTTATLPSSSWTTQSDGTYSKALTVSGILATDSPIIDINTSSLSKTQEDAVIEAWANARRIVTSANTLTFYFTEAPTVDIPIKIKEVR